jgi:hypothetical protein
VYESCSSVFIRESPLCQTVGASTRAAVVMQHPGATSPSTGSLAPLS